MSDSVARYRQRRGVRPNLVGKIYGQIDGLYNGETTKPLLHDPYIVRPSASTAPALNYERTWDQTNPGPPFEKGGGFLSVKVKQQFSELQGGGIYKTRGTGPPDAFRQERYTGAFAEPPFTGDLPYDHPHYANVGAASDGFDSSMIPDLSGLGPEAYNRLRPPIEKAGVGQFIGELRDVPRTLQATSKAFHGYWNSLTSTSRKLSSKSPLMAPKKAADQFLTYQFGWVPFVKDVHDIINVMYNSKEYIDRAKADNNRWQKRRVVLGNTHNISVIEEGNGMAVWPAGETFSQMLAIGSNGGVVSPTWRTTLEQSKKTWATGLFKYYRPEFDSSPSGTDSDWKRLMQIRLLLGLRINPSVLYKVTPWTWLGDWVTNVGRNISNATDRGLDGSVFKNLYIMCHTVDKVVFEQTVPFHTGTISMKWTRIIETKQRVEGGPYGLGWAFGDLSGRQKMILASLGLLRLG